METALPRSQRKVPKPLMEKRRRERINHSLETLRRLLLENTSNEKLSNPKVEKAEILESVVEFLRTEHEGEHPSMKRALTVSLSQPPFLSLSTEEGDRPSMKRTLTLSPSLSTEGAEESTCKRRKSYHEGMRACLLRVSHFISTKTQELEDTSESVALTDPAVQVQFCQSATISSSQDPAVTAEQHVFQQQPPPQSAVFKQQPPPQSAVFQQQPPPQSAVFQQQPPPQSAVFQHSQTKGPGMSWPPQRTAVRPSAGRTELSDSVWRPWPQ